VIIRYTLLYVARNSQRISLMIKTSRCIIAGCNSCVRTCAYVSSSSKIPILRVLFTMLEAGRHVPAFEQYAVATANRGLISRFFTHAKTNCRAEKRARSLPMAKNASDAARISAPPRSISSKDTARVDIQHRHSGELLSYKRRSTDKIRISSLSFIVEFYCAYYATGNKRARANK